MVEVCHREIAADPRYRVGDDGSVWSRRAGPWRRLKGHVDPQGYVVVLLGRRKDRLVHRLVLEAFVGPCPEGMECRHLDGDPANNRRENLCWGTRRSGERHHRAKLSDLQARIIRHAVAPGRRDGVASMLARAWGVSAAAVRLIARGERRAGNV
jgi:hypothetical protein